MKTCITTRALAAAAALSAAAAFAALPDGWTDDFDAAKKQAAQEGKRLLVDFSGSDWCGWCKRLDKEVFAQKDFVSKAKKNFVLVLIDSPQDKSILSEKAAKQNPGLVKQYNIHGFPSVLIMDAEGNTLYSTGYRRGGAKAYLKHLDDVTVMLAVKEKISKEIEGLDKGSAKRLAAIDAALGKLDKVDNDVLDDCTDYVNELLANDPSGKYAKKYPYFSIVKPLMTKLRKLFGQMNSEMRSKVRALGHSPSNDELAKIRAELEEKFASSLSEIKDEIEAARGKAPASAKKDLDNLAKPLESIGVKRAKGK